MEAKTKHSLQEGHLFSRMEQLESVPNCNSQEPMHWWTWETGQISNNSQYFQLLTGRKKKTLIRALQRVQLLCENIIKISHKSNTCTRFTEKLLETYSTCKGSKVLEKRHLNNEAKQTLHDLTPEPILSVREAKSSILDLYWGQKRPRPTLGQHHAAAVNDISK